jgi:hypothetical protein
MAGVAVTVSIVAFDATIISTIMPQVADALGGMCRDHHDFWSTR